MTTSPRQWEVFNRLRGQGWNRAAAAREAGIAYKTAQRREMVLSTVAKSHRPAVRDGLEAPAPVPLDELRPEAAAALEDFGLFQRRYFGRVATPWQEEAAYDVKQFLETPEKEYLVINAPPGSGKSTTFTLDLPAWLTCRDRAVRGLLGTLRASTARWYLRRLKNYLETTIPIQPEADQVSRGLAVPTVACLVDDFGVFKPIEGRDTWNQDAIVVAQHGNVLTAQKEPTWTCYGMESGFLGMRFGVIFWDDLVDPHSLRTSEARAKQEQWWDDIAERRLEPGGLLVLQGQRMGPDDLYRYNLNKVVADDDEEEESGGERPRMYHHIVFKAHYEDRCVGGHAKTAAYYPDGCLLDPRRVSWADQQRARANRNYETIFQQQDADPAAVLVNPLYVTGGTDPKTGIVYPGCRDLERGTAELPDGLAGDLLSIATADPSPTKFWSIQWWIVRCAEGQAQERYLMDLDRRAMDAPTFLDWSEPTRQFTGLMEDWQARSVRLGLPIRTWIVEKNGAQRFMLQYEHMRRWLAHWRVDLIPHETTTNKSDPEYGVQTLEGIYKYGLVRLPFKNHTDAAYNSLKLVEEVTHYPDWRTDDCVMAQWFLEWRLPHLIPQAGGLPRFERPTWLKKADTYSWRNMWKQKVSA